MDERKVCVFDIQKFSVHDGPGIRTIVFFKGCPLRCEWCANPESQHAFPELMYYPDKCIGCGKCIDVCPRHAVASDNGQLLFDRTLCVNCGKCAEDCFADARKMSGNMMSIEEIIKEVDKDILFYEKSGGGITFSGGEAMLYPEFVRDIAKSYKDRGISTAIETCGFVPWKNFEMCIDHLDTVLFDLKCVDEEKHIRHCGGSNKIILENIEKAAQRTDLVIRIPIIPGFNDSEEDIDAAGTWMKEHLGGSRRMHILPYHDFGSGKYKALGRIYPTEDLEKPSDEHMEKIKHAFESYGFDVVIGG